MKSTLKLLTLFAALLLIAAGCEYDVAEPQWTQDHDNPSVPVITAMNPPDGAMAGVNTITIIGENFADETERNRVYFDNAEAEIIESSSTAIKVRRPNKVNDATRVKVVSYDALLVAEYGPYPLVQVQEPYGDILEAMNVGAMTIDKDEALYFVNNTSGNIYKVTPAGDKSVIGVNVGNSSDLKMTPDGQLIVLFNNKVIRQVNTDAAVDTATAWIEVSKRVKYGDFDANGNFYTGTASSDLIVVKTSDMTTRALGLYARDEIFCVRVFNQYVYVLVELRSGEPAMAIWRHAILDADGNVGPAELVLDWADTGEFAESVPSGFIFDVNGNMFVSSDYVHPMLVVYTDGTQDIFYKDILPTPIVQMFWGAGDYLYLLWQVAAGERQITRVDMGTPGAPYFGW